MLWAGAFETTRGAHAGRGRTQGPREGTEAVGRDHPAGCARVPPRASQGIRDDVEPARGTAVHAARPGRENGPGSARGARRGSIHPPDPYDDLSQPPLDDDDVCRLRARPGRQPSTDACYLPPAMQLVERTLELSTEQVAGRNAMSSGGCHVR